MVKRKSIKQSKSKIAFRSGLYHIAPLETLNKLRKILPIGEYKDCIQQFTVYGNSDASLFFGLGKSESEKLVGQYIGLDPLPLKNELYWAAHWIVTQVNQINIYLEERRSIQDLILEDEYVNAIQSIDEFIKNYGWSFWAIEVRCSLESTVNGMEGLTEWLMPLHKDAGQRINSLLYEILSDRCDDTFSFYAFYSKCQNSFPRIKNVNKWVPPYLQYRTFNDIPDPKNNIPLLLAKEITSCLIDYYELFIASLVYVATDESLHYLKPTAKTVILKLIEGGIKDHRLNKLVYLFVDEDEIELSLNPLDNSNFLNSVNAMNPVNSESKLKNEISNLIIKCQELGNAAQDEISRLLKIGLNYKSLDLGKVVLNASLNFVYNDSGYSQNANQFIINNTFTLEDITTFEFEKGIKLLNKYKKENDLIQSVVDIHEGRLDSLKISKNVIFLWLANHLFNEKKYAVLEVLLDRLNSFGGFWSREVAKFNVEILNEKGQIIEAIDLINRWIIDSPRAINDFNVHAIFEGRKWQSFKKFDYFKVGLLSHYAFQLTDIQGVGYICKMACRSIFLSGMRENIISIFKKNEELQELIIHFFANVWIDENLSLWSELNTTQLIRQERIEILQLLLQLDHDKKRSAKYTDEIKDLTFDQTLQKGLKYIDQTRIFVNESAISRWAESEILPNFNRWMTLRNSSSGTRLIDDIISQFSVDPNNIDLLQNISDGQPSVSSAMLVDIIGRLYQRFLNDPTDGLDCYLSLRIRHGTLRGTILGPLEEQRLLYFPEDISKQEFLNTWSHHLDLDELNLEKILMHLEIFSKKIKSLVDELVNDFVQIQSSEKPRGAFKYLFNPDFLRVMNDMLDDLDDEELSFSTFLNNSYFLFWRLLVDLGLKDLNSYVSINFKKSFKNEFDELICIYRCLNHQSKLTPLITMLQRISTDTQTQCDVVSNWFRLPTHADEDGFQLPDAINIAQAATQNVYRALDANFHHEDTIKISLTTTALAGITDCLFVIFENAWKHSGLGSELKNISIETEFDDSSKLLTLRVYNDLSEDRIAELTPNEISRLKKKYIETILPIHLVSKEGGSGFPKLRRSVRSIKKSQCPNPFDFGLQNSRWFVQITIQLFEREGRFEAHV